jgi:hypothetical protein
VPVGGLSAFVRNGARIAAAAALIAGLGGESLWASETTIAGGPMIQRSMRVVPRRYAISPSGATVAANQTQHFDVLDSNGQPVAVRWNVSGLGCYGASCGSIDEQGTYRPPSALPKPRIVTLEGVVVSDPHYSVLTEIRLEAAKETNRPALAENSLEEPQLVAPAVPKAPAIGNRVETMPLPRAVTSAPALAGVDVVRTAELGPLPSAVAAAPKVGTVRGTRSADPALPSVVAPAPPIENQKISSRADALPVPRAVDSAPSVGAMKNMRTKEVPLALVVGAAPTVGKNARRKDMLPLPAAVGAAPVVGSASVASRKELLPVPGAVSAAPAVGTVKPARTADVLPLPAAVSAAPTVANSPAAPHAEPTAMTPVVAAAPKGEVLATARSAAAVASPAAAQGPSFTPLTVQPQLAAQPVLRAAIPANPASPLLQAMPDETGKAAAQSTPQDSVRVTYRDGQLTIDVRNATLAEVLKVVGEKTGATIDIPPGSGLDPIVEHAGPGTPNDVLTQLLNGSHFNFILVNSPQQPQQLARVLLSVQPADTGNAPVPQALIPAAATWTQPQSPAIEVLPPRYDSTLTVPSNVQSLTPEERGQLMREKAMEIRARASQQYPPEQPPPPQ